MQNREDDSRKDILYKCLNKNEWESARGNHCM